MGHKMNIVILFNKTLRRIGHVFIKLAQLFQPPDYDKSTIIKKGVTRNLYKTRFNDFFWLDENENDCISQSIINTGVWEYNLTKVVRQLIKKGDIVLDVGANIGYYSILFSKLVGQNGKVLCFEPTEYFLKILKMNLEANRISNVEVFKIGLSDKRREAEIEIEGPSASFHCAEDLTPRTKELVNLISLDEFIEQHSLEKIDLIKVDIDGHEPLFLQGAWEILDKYNPVILLEVSHPHYLKAGFTAWDFYDLLKKKNYRIYHQDKLTEIKTKKDFLIKCGNFAYSANVVISKKELKI